MRKAMRLAVRVTLTGVGSRTETTTSFPAGLVNRFAYDKAGRVVSQTAPPVTDRVTGAVHTPSLQ